MTYETAIRFVEAARRIAASRDLDVTVAVHDAAGHPVALARGKNWHGPYLAMGKARLAAAFRKPTKDLLEQWSDRPLFAHSLTEVIPGGVTLNAGGMPIFAGQTCVGAIGIGGGSPDQDDLVARLTVDEVRLD